MVAATHRAPERSRAHGPPVSSARKLQPTAAVKNQAKALELRQQLQEFTQRLRQHTASLAGAGVVDEHVPTWQHEDCLHAGVELEQASSSDASCPSLPLWNSIDSNDCISDLGGVGETGELEPLGSTVANARPSAMHVLRPRYFCCIGNHGAATRCRPRDRPFVRMSQNMLHVGNAKWSRRFELDALHSGALSLARDIFAWFAVQKAASTLSARTSDDRWRTLTVLAFGAGSGELVLAALRAFPAHFVSEAHCAASFVEVGSSVARDALEDFRLPDSALDGTLTGDSPSVHTAACLDDTLRDRDVAGVGIKYEWPMPEGGQRCRLLLAFARVAEGVDRAVSFASATATLPAEEAVHEPIVPLLASLGLSGRGDYMSPADSVWVLGCIQADPQPEDMLTLEAVAGSRKRGSVQQKPQLPQGRSRSTPSKEPPVLASTPIKSAPSTQRAARAKAPETAAFQYQVQSARKLPAVEELDGELFLQVKLLAAANLAGGLENPEWSDQGLRRVIVSIRVGNACSSMGPFDCDAWRDPIWDVQPQPLHFFPLPASKGQKPLLDISLSCAVPHLDERVSLGSATADVKDLIPGAVSRLWLPIKGTGGAIKVELCTIFDQDPQAPSPFYSEPLADATGKSREEKCPVSIVRCQGEGYSGLRSDASAASVASYASSLLSPCSVFTDQPPQALGVPKSMWLNCNQPSPVQSCHHSSSGPLFSAPTVGAELGLPLGKGIFDWPSWPVETSEFRQRSASMELSTGSETSELPCS